MAVDRPPYVNFYPSDWKGGTANLPPMLEWTYLQVCLFNWDRGAAMPAGQSALHLSRNPDWERDLAQLCDLEKVIRTAGGHYFVPRALREAERSNNAYSKKRDAGREGAKKRWSKDDRSPADDLPNGDLVFSVPKSVMADFRAHRRKIKKPMTERAEQLILTKLEKLLAEGHDPAAVVEQSIENGWAGVFPIREERDGKRNRDSGRGLFDASSD